jgi:hypothetical protein
MLVAGQPPDLLDAVGGDDGAELGMHVRVLSIDCNVDLRMN